MVDERPDDPTGPRAGAGAVGQCRAQLRRRGDPVRADPRAPGPPAGGGTGSPRRLPDASRRQCAGPRGRPGPRVRGDRPGARDQRSRCRSGGVLGRPRAPPGRGEGGGSIATLRERSAPAVRRTAIAVRTGTGARCNANVPPLEQARDSGRSANRRGVAPAWADRGVHGLWAPSSVGSSCRRPPRSPFARTQRSASRSWSSLLPVSLRLALR